MGHSARTLHFIPLTLKRNGFLDSFGVMGWMTKSTQNSLQIVKLEAEVRELADKQTGRSRAAKAFLLRVRQLVF